MTGQTTTLSRRLVPLVMSGFFNSFTDSGFKVWAVLFILQNAPWLLQDAGFLLAGTAVCLLPSLLLPMVTGFAADRLPGRCIIALIAIGKVMLFGFTEAALHGSSWQFWSVAVLFSLVNAFFPPAFDALLPLSFSEKELSRACSRTASASTCGFIAGIALMPGAFYFHIPAPVLISASLLAIIAAVRIVPVITPVQRKRELAYPFKDTLKRGFAAFCGRAGLWTAASGEVCFIGLSLTALPLLILFARQALHMQSSVNIVLLLLAPGIGFVTGCFIAGLFSRNKIEPGLIPLGALGVITALPLMIFFPGKVRQFMLNFSDGSSMEILFYAGAWFWAAFAGFACGMLFVPLRTYILQRLRPELRGAALALRNAVTYAVSALAMLLVVSLSSGTVPGIPPLLGGIAGVPYQILLGAFGLLVMSFTLLALWQLPNFLLRFLILTVGHLIYRIRISGAENIPERGPALLLCNHVSAIDSILISACTSRQIRFLLYDDYFKVPLLGAVAGMTGFFKIPSAGKTKALVRVLRNIRKHLADGGLICVFPEGRLSGNGLAGEFKQGYEKMLPDGVDIPIIPVNISFAWGSVFSNFFTRPGIRKKIKLPFFPAVTFGKAIKRDTPVFEIRQKIIELGAQAAMNALPDELTLHHAAVHHAKKNLWKKRFSDCSGKALSTFELTLSAAVISRHLRRHLGSDERFVGILLPNGIPAVKAILAVLMADRIPVPLNYSTSQEVLDISMEKAALSMVITERFFLKNLRISPGDKAVFIEDIAKNCSVFGRLAMGAGMLLLPTGEFMNLLSPLSAFELNNDAVLLFSSGSTGNPKGVRLSHHNLNINARSVANALTIDRGDLIVGNLPLFHSFGLNVCFWIPVRYGIPVSYIANPLDSMAVCRSIVERKATMLFATPSFLQKYLRRCTGEELASLRLIATGAEKLRDDIAQKVRDLTGGRLEVVECYGCTELSPVVSINLPLNASETGRRIGSRDSIGIPLENISVRILDPLSFTPVEPGEEGILCVKGSLVMQGYLNDEEQSAEVMTGEYYKTGDVAKMDENGYLHICGRLSRFSKIAGEMVPHELVEKTINELCACDSRVVAVCTIPDPVKGEALLVLYTPEMPFTPEKIVDQLRECSISNLWIPKVKNFHPVDQLPLLGSGKLDLARLRQIAAEIAAKTH
ncbi:MAG: MFS transporter [Lentisphaeria bacterium]|nr:MFS transporter [Lentisphaeria bacterium]